MLGAGKKSLKFAVGAAFALLVIGNAGCNPWYLVESEYQGVTLQNQPDVQETETYTALVHPGVSVALSAPDECAGESAAEATGGPTTSRELLATSCGVEMAELERGLAAAGFRVVSWNAIQQMVTHEENLTPLEAAQALHATVLLQVNSLEKTKVRAGKDLQWSRTFYSWDLNFFEWFFGAGSNGKKGAVVEVPEERAVALEYHMGLLESQAFPTEQASVTVNATAIAAETGEAIWFYSWTHSEKIGGEYKLDQVFECNPHHLSYCIAQGSISQPVSAGPTRSGSRGSVRIPSQSASPEGAAHYKLWREVVEDMVGRLRQPHPAAMPRGTGASMVR